MTSTGKSTSKGSSAKAGRTMAAATGAPAEGNFTSIDKVDLLDLSYVAIYNALPKDRIEIVRAGIKASLAKRIVADLEIPAAMTYEALHIPVSTINRKARTGAVLRPDESERILGLAKLVGQVESMVEGMDGAEGFDAPAWTSRWLREPVPALGGRAPLDYMATMEGQLSCPTP